MLPPPTPAKKKMRKHAQSKYPSDAKKKKTHTETIIGLLFGLVGLFVSVAGLDSVATATMIIALLIAITGFALSTLSLKGKKKGLAIAGLVIVCNMGLKPSPSRRNL